MNDTALAARPGCDWNEWVRKMRSDAGLFTLIGCLGNRLPLDDNIDAQRHVLLYEQLASHDSREWRRLLDCLGLDNRPEISALQRPSQQSTQAMGKSALKQSVSLFDRLTPEDKAGLQRVLDLFAVTFIIPCHSNRHPTN